MTEAKQLPQPPDFGPQIEPLATAYESPTVCDPIPKPGVKAFRSWVLDHLGGTDLGISRACKPVDPATDEHQEGRAWDWGMRAEDPRTAELLEYLTAPDKHGNVAANARRVGLMYMISDRKIWRAYAKPGIPAATWVPYTKPGGDPHTTHVHFSFTRAGASGKTSFWRSRDGQWVHVLLCGAVLVAIAVAVVGWRA